MLTPNRRPYALRPYPSVELDRPSHLDEILPQKSKQNKPKKYRRDKFNFLRRLF